MTDETRDLDGMSRDELARRLSMERIAHRATSKQLLASADRAESLAEQVAAITGERDRAHAKINGMLKHIRELEAKLATAGVKLARLERVDERRDSITAELHGRANGLREALCMVLDRAEAPPRFQPTTRTAYDRSKLDEALKDALADLDDEGDS